MKQKQSSENKLADHSIDQRTLVNLDLYENEIKVLKEELDKVQSETLSKEAQKRRVELNNEMNVQSRTLGKFRHNYDVEELIQDKPGHKKEAADLDYIPRSSENFFIHLQSFEDAFKVIREKVNEFLEKHL